jgi:hypothetical protein
MNQVMDRVLQVVALTEHPNIHLVDIENLIGYGKFPASEVKRVRDLYRLASSLKSSDLVIIASGPQNKRSIYEGWSGAMYLWRRGQNGADFALVEFFDSLNDLSQYGRLFIGSGDKEFATVADAAVLAGLPTTVIARQGTLSYRLSMHSYIDLSLQTHSMINLSEGSN